MENKKGVIYGLVCPLSNELKYVGQTRYSSSYRLNGILQKYKNRKTPFTKKRDIWLNTLEGLGVINKIDHFIIEECSLDEIGEKEEFWIDYFLFLGCNLINVAKGGTTPKGWGYKGEENSFFGRNHSENARRIMAEKASIRVGDKNSFYGKKHTEESIEKIRNKSLLQERKFRKIILIDVESESIVDVCDSIYDYIEKYSPPYKWRTIYNKIKKGTPINGFILKNPDETTDSHIQGS